MCGICGFYSKEQSAQAMVLQEATRSLAHRGPDGMKTWLNESGTVGLGHTRLAIIDLEAGQQPMATTDGRYVGVFNGEIYNFRELREELEGLDYQFRTRSDTEVLLAAFRQWGQDCLLRLDGMFAFAIYDIAEQKLFLARDRTGIKPLYYHHGPWGLVFGSELKSILVWPHVSRRINPEALADFLVLGYPLTPATGFRDCYELNPGSYLEVSKAGFRQARYWSWMREEMDWNESIALELVERELTQAVQGQLVADVPIGAFLSGGIDSSLLVALLARAEGPRIKTFTVKFEDQKYDESAFARAVAREVGSEHHEITVKTADEGLSLVDKVLAQFDQPFGDSSAIPTYLICQEIRKHVKVVIGGDGGDEMFGGYSRFFYADVARFLGMRHAWLHRLGEAVLQKKVLLPAGQRRQMLRMIRAAAEDGGDRLTSICSQVPIGQLKNVVEPDLQALLGSYRPSLMTTNGHRHVGGLEMIDATIRATLPADYLRKVDIMSSAHGLEVRVPMLANRILELSSKLPNRWKYSGMQNKVLLRKLAQLRLPREVAEKKKQGFGIPLDSWLGHSGRAELCDVLSGSRSPLRGLIQNSYVQRLTRAFLDLRWDRSEWSRYGVYQRVYALWSLHRWLNVWQPSL